MKSKGKREEAPRGPAGGEMDANAMIVGGYLAGYAPAGEYGPGVMVMTTDEIIAGLTDMADVGQGEVNRVLVSMGYSPGRNEAGSYGWLLRPLEGEREPPGALKGENTEV